MEWSLAIVALTLLGVAAISRRLSGTPVTPAIVFVAVELLVGPKALGEIDLESSDWRSGEASGPRLSAWARCRSRSLSTPPCSWPSSSY